MSSALINVMSAAVLKAGKGLMRDFGEVDHLHISRKGAANFVTAADIRTEKLLQKELSAARPAFGFLMEEGGEVAGKDGVHRWIIDPLDGTNNFIHSIPYFCISVGLEKRDASGKSEIIAGVIFDPIHNELFTAEKGQGALLNGNKKLLVSARPTLADSMIAVGAVRCAMHGDKRADAQFSAVSKCGAIVRDFGATALDLAYVAAGRIDALRAFLSQPWDLAAGLLLVQEAGGMLSSLDDSTPDSYCKDLIASNPAIHPQLRALYK